MNYTIYIASDLDKQDKFFGEENKSGLINDLLRQHYGITDKDIESIARKMDEETKPEYITPIIKTSKDAVEKVKAIPKLSGRDYCEHGQLKGRCLWKGCKYS